MGTASRLRRIFSAPDGDGVLVSAFEDVDGIRTHYRMSASESANLPVVCVHGLAVSHRYLAPLAWALAPTHPVYLPDLPGFGLSDKPDRTYGAAEHAQHLAAWLDELGLGNVCLFGHSFGAQVAAALAANHPQRIAGVVLAGPITDPLARTWPRELARFAVDATREETWQAPILLHDIWQAGVGRVRQTVSLSLTNTLERDIVRIPVPVLVLRGELDPIATAPWCTTVAQQAETADLVTIEGAAHNVATTSPVQVAAAVSSFLRLRLGTTAG